MHSVGTFALRGAVVLAVAALPDDSATSVVALVEALSCTKTSVS